MQRDLYHTIAHFINDASFREWVQTGADRAGWERWAENHPGKSRLIEEARVFLLAIGNEPADDDTAETEQVLSETWERLGRRENTGPRTPFRLWWKASAAILLIVSGISWYVLENREASLPETWETRAPGQPATDTIRLFNSTATSRLINLEDGSSVILEPGGTLTYPAAFRASTREVYLSGEAFFEIAKNPGKPFLVFTNDIVTRVVGTSFRIRAIESQPDVKVSVKTGRVNIRQIRQASHHLPEEIALRPNESVSFLKDLNVFEKSRSGELPRKAVENMSFEFTDTPVKRIFAAIETAYGVTVDYPEAVLHECYLSTSLADEPLLEKLKIICESLGNHSSFSMKENRITINSTGCN